MTNLTQVERNVVKEERDKSVEYSKEELRSNNNKNNRMNKSAILKIKKKESVKRKKLKQQLQNWLALSKLNHGL